MGRWFKGCIQLGLLLSLVLLSGCLHYDLDIQFDSQTHGQLVQRLQWQPGTLISPSAPDNWLELLKRRTQAVGGTIQAGADSTLTITIPFNNGQDLQDRFNQFFEIATAASPFTLPDGKPIQAHLSIQQRNRVLAIYNSLSLRIDLTAVPDLKQVGLTILQKTPLLTGEVAVTTPWGLRSLADDPLFTNQWPLMAGEINQIDAEFWLPSPIGIGALAIAVLVVLGYSLKYGLLSKPKG